MRLAHLIGALTNIRRALCVYSQQVLTQGYLDFRLHER